MIKTYDIDNVNQVWDCRVQIDEDFIIAGLELDGQPFTTAMAIKEMVEFWVGWKERLKENDGNYTKTFLQQLGREILYLVAENDYNTYGVIEEFKNRDGWFEMDGTCGIAIVDVATFAFDYYEFLIKEVES